MPDLDIHYEDPDILVINKPAGLLSVPGRGEDKYDSVQSRCQEIAPEAMAAHRLDMASCSSPNTRPPNAITNNNLPNAASQNATSPSSTAFSRKPAATSTTRSSPIGNAVPGRKSITNTAKVHTPAIRFSPKKMAIAVWPLPRTPAAATNYAFILPPSATLSSATNSMPTNISLPHHA